MAAETTVIQGTADVSNKLSQYELAQTLDFCASAFDHTQPEEKEYVLQKVMSNGGSIMDDKLKEVADAYQKSLSTEELRVINHIRARSMIDTKSTFDLDNFGTDVINGMRVNLQRGNLGLVIINNGAK